MPKTIINEIDKTKAGNINYQNFSVVVPGVLGTPASGYDPSDIFDDNGIAQVTSQEMFENYIGKVCGSTTATCASYIDLGHVMTKQEFYSYGGGTTDSIVYTWEVITQPAQKTAGAGKIHNDAGWFKLSESPIVSGEYDETISGTYIAITDYGRDSTPYNGNQIAYELLGLGYEVLYKKVTDYSDLSTFDFWKCLLDKSTYDFRYICTGGYYDINAYKQICAIANQKTKYLDDNDTNNGRGDCIALVDIDETNFTQASIIDNIYEAVTKLQDLNKYAAIFCPKVTYSGDAEEVLVYKNLTFPASFHYLACAAYAFGNLNYNEWYAVAGYTRGVCSKTVDHTSFKLGEIAANALQPRVSNDNISYAVNIITNIKGNYYLWGNRTACKLNSSTDQNPGLIASHFLNIRQLCCTLKKDIYIACGKFRFDPNSDILWGNFCNAIKPTLEKMKADQGISDYKIIKVKSDKKALLTAKVRIVPIEAVEDFVIDVYLEDSLSDTVVSSEE